MSAVIIVFPLAVLCWQCYYCERPTTYMSFEFVFVLSDVILVFIIIILTLVQENKMVFTRHSTNID